MRPRNQYWPIIDMNGQGGQPEPSLGIGRAPRGDGRAAAVAAGLLACCRPTADLLVIVRCRVLQVEPDNDVVRGADAARYARLDELDVRV